LDSATQIVRRGERVIPLTRTEYLLLEFLLRRPGRVLSRQAIVEPIAVLRALRTNPTEILRAE
jgi:two-component system response regulator MprA